MAYIKEKDLKAIFAKSGNKCAFPECNQKLVNDDYIFMGQVAHIEAQNEGGPRYNPNQTDDERNSANNLICLCRNHHYEIDIYPEIYTVEKLQEIKKEHEKIYGTIVWNFDYSRIKKVNDDLQEYLYEMKAVNDNNDDELKREINTTKSFETLLNDIRGGVNHFGKLSLKLSRFMEHLNVNIIKQLKKLGYDTNEWEKQFYVDNPFWHPFWEELALGAGNNFNELKINITHLEILYYSLYLLINDDKKVQKKLEKAKTRFKKMCESAMYYD